MSESRYTFRDTTKHIKILVYILLLLDIFILFFILLSATSLQSGSENEEVDCAAAFAAFKRNLRGGTRGKFSRSSNPSLSIVEFVFSAWLSPVC